MEHHPIFSRFPGRRGQAPDGFRIDFLGVRTRLAFEERMPYASAPAAEPPDSTILPSFDEEYFEWIPFHVGNAAGWYGQALADAAAVSADRKSRGRLRRFLPTGWRQSELAAEETAVVRVPSVTLPTILRGFERVDLIDLDVQDAEADVLSQAIDPLERKVRRVHVGTHSQEVEEKLRRLFPAHGWDSRNDYPCLKSSHTPYGEIAFNDGVQTWLNPRLKEGANPLAD